VVRTKIKKHGETKMSIQKKSLIGNLKTAQKAIVAALDATKPLRPVAGEPKLTTAKRENLRMAKYSNLTMAKRGKALATAKNSGNLTMAKAGKALAMAKAADFITAKR
jgi:hypothetical protein